MIVQLRATASDGMVTLYDAAGIAITAVPECRIGVAAAFDVEWGEWAGRWVSNLRGDRHSADVESLGGWEAKFDVWRKSLRTRRRNVERVSYKRLNHDPRPRYTNWDEALCFIAKNLDAKLRRSEDDCWDRWARTVEANHRRRAERHGAYVSRPRGAKGSD